MENPRTYLAKVKGAVPEKFIFVTLHPDLSGIESRSGSVSEPELREFFRTYGDPDLRIEEIDTCLERARQHEV